MYTPTDVPPGMPFEFRAWQIMLDFAWMNWALRQRVKGRMIRLWARNEKGVFK